MAACWPPCYPVVKLAARAAKPAARVERRRWSPRDPGSSSLLMIEPSQKTYVNLSPAREASSSREDDLYKAVQATVASDYELLGELGRGDGGRVVYLARERASGSLVALRLDRGGASEAEYELTVLPHLDETVPSAGSACPYCGNHVRDWARFCPHCGRDISGEAEADSGSGFNTAQLLQAVRESAADEYEVLGEMPRARGGGRVYFARDLATGAIIALRLHRERSDSGPDQFSLGRTQVLKPLVADLGAKYASPSVVASPAPPTAAPAPTPAAPPPPPRAAVESRGPGDGSGARSATPAASAPRPAPPEGRTVVGLQPITPAVAPNISGGEQAPPDVAVDPTAVAARKRRTVIIGAGAAIALLGALALALADKGDEFSKLDTVRVDTTAPSQPPKVDSTIAQPPVDSSRDSSVVKRPEPSLLVVTGELPPGATILVDGRRIRGRQATLTPGSHTLSVRADGFEPFTQRVQASGDTTTWSPRLRRAKQLADTTARPRVDSQPKPPAPTCARAFGAQDWSNARNLCRTEASSGDAAAQRDLALLLLRGQGGPVDEPGGVTWLQRAAGADDPQALFELGRVYQTHKAYRDDRRAYDNFRRAALRGHTEAQFQAGRALEHGVGTSENLREAFLMYEQSAKSGYAPAQTAVGVFLKKGLGTPRDDRKALEWLTKAAAGGSPDGYFHIGELHEQGRAGLPKSKADAMEWYRKGAALGSEEARRALRR